MLTGEIKLDKKLPRNKIHAAYIRQLAPNFISYKIADRDKKPLSLSVGWNVKIIQLLVRVVQAMIFIDIGLLSLSVWTPTE